MSTAAAFERTNLTRPAATFVPSLLRTSCFDEEIMRRIGILPMLCHLLDDSAL
jgi:hypothetical protein